MSLDDIPEIEPGQTGSDTLVPVEVAEESEELAVAEDGGVAGRLGSASTNARNALAAGLSGVKAVNKAKREHAAARSRLRQLNAGIADSAAELERRDRIENTYDAIVSQQSAEIADARSVQAAAHSHAAQINAQIKQLNEELAATSAANEQERRPYKNLMESSKGRADDTAAALASARRSVRSAENALADATDRRENRIAAANRAVDGASARITQLSAEIAQLEGDPSTDYAALENLQYNKATEEAHLRQAKAEVLSVTDETQQIVANAQNAVFSARQALGEAEREAEQARAEAKKHKEAFDRMYEEHQAQESEIKKRIADSELALAQTAKEEARAEQRIEEAQVILDDANNVHATPEYTEALRKQVSEARETIAQQEREVEALAAGERETREATRTNRFVFIGALVLLVVAIVLAVLFFAGVFTPKS